MRPAVLQKKFAAYGQHSDDCYIGGGDPKSNEGPAKSGSLVGSGSVRQLPLRIVFLPQSFIASSGTPLLDLLEHPVVAVGSLNEANEL